MLAMQRCSSARGLCGSSSGACRSRFAFSTRRPSRGAVLNSSDPSTTDKPTVPDTAPASTSSSSNGTPPSTSGRASPAATPTQSRPTSTATSTSSQEEEGFSWGSFWSGPLPGKLAALLGLIVLSRVGVYVRLPGVDVDAFANTMASNGLLGYVDALSGGSISKVGRVAEKVQGAALVGWQQQQQLMVLQVLQACLPHLPGYLHLVPSGPLGARMKHACAVNSRGSTSGSRQTCMLWPGRSDAAAVKQSTGSPGTCCHSQPIAWDPSSLWFAATPTSPPFLGALLLLCSVDPPVPADPPPSRPLPLLPPPPPPPPLPPQVGLFSLGIIPYINASIVLQLLSAAFPSLKKMQREDGPQGRARFQYYQKLAAFVFAIAQVGVSRACMCVCVCVGSGQGCTWGWGRGWGLHRAVCGVWVWSPGPLQAQRGCWLSQCSTPAVGSLRMACCLPGPTCPHVLLHCSVPHPLTCCHAPCSLQAVGQLTYIRPYVTDFSPEWLAGSSLSLVAGALGLIYIADTISELKLGNGTSVLIFANIASSLPSSVGALLAQNANDDPGNVVVYATAFFLTTLGIIYVQEAERRIPVNYSSR